MPIFFSRFVGVLIPLLGVLPGHKEWPLQVLYPHYVSRIKLLVLPSGSFPHPRSLEFARDFPKSLTPINCRLPLFLMALFLPTTGADIS